MPQPLLKATDRGVYCPAGRFYIDPWAAVEHAIITHGHTDHARWGCEKYLTTPTGAIVLEARFGASFRGRMQALPYGQSLTINDVRVSLHPAGHVLGSAMVRVEHQGEVWVASGDYKTQRDGISEPWEPVRCHTFITESTFGLPIFRWRAPEELSADLNTWWRANADAGRTSAVFGYSLGKAQRLIAAADPAIGPIFIHGAMTKTTQAYRDAGIHLPPTTHAERDLVRAAAGRALVIAPPIVVGSPWLRKFGDVATAFASGWMQVRGTRRRRNVDRGFALSDHADWPGLLHAIKESGATSIGVTHGSVGTLVRYLCETGLNAWALPTRYVGEAADEDATEAEAAISNGQADAPDDGEKGGVALMLRFARLYAELDATTSRDDKTAALERYFREVDAPDGAWALAILTGRRVRRAVSSTELRQAAQQASGLPAWLIDECYSSVGDLGETLALIIPDPAGPESPRPSLHELFTRTVLPMRRMSEAQRLDTLRATWAKLDGFERFVFHKLLSGTFRVGVSRLIAVRAMATVAGVSQAEMDHRLLGEWDPTAEFFDALRSGKLGEGTDAAPVARPYPFYLAHQLDSTPWATDDLGPITDWQAEWKWDGIRAQLIRRAGQSLLWSRGEELITQQFPELADAALSLPDGTVLDGEVLAWDLGGAERPLPFAALQTRINRKEQGLRLFNDVPVVFMAYDVLEHAGADWRQCPMHERRATLERLLLKAPPLLRASSLVIADSWKDLAAQREQARARGVEGLMLKRRASGYGVGRTRGEHAGGSWWKWKIDPYSVDAVLIYAQRGTGRRAALYTDYTFGLWTGPERGQGELVPIAKAYSGLTDEEIAKVDAFIREHATGKLAGAAIVTVEPSLVFELAFEGIAPSNRHKSGLAVRFPRMARWRTDKKAAEADTLDTLRRLLAATGQEAAR